MKRTAVFIMALTLLVFGGVVALVTLRLRERVRDEVLEREASILSAVARREARYDGQTLLDLVLRVVDMDGVIGVRLYESDGSFLRALPDNLVAGGPMDSGLPGSRLVTSRLTEHVLLCTLYADPFGELGDETLPMLNIMVPILDPEDTQVKGYAEFLLDARPTVDTFVRLDHDLLRQAALAFLGGGLLICAILLLSIRQLERKNRDLAAANRQLSIHAKTAAIGAVSSHLFHGLKNAIAGLNLVMEGGDDALSDVRAGTRRLEQMVQEVIDVIKEEQHGITYDLTAREILDVVTVRTQALAASRDVQVETHAEQNRRFGNRDANLMLLALENLVNNAIEVSPAGQGVTCRYLEDRGRLRFTVTDHGSGIPDEYRARLFEPGGSSKASGNGIGLSITYQLCRHLGGALQLVETGPGGTTFELVVPGSDAV